MDTIVIKMGGSLALYPRKLKDLCRKLSEASKKHNIIVVPGGGEFADLVRVMDKRFSLSDSISHHMAILAMDQYGFLLSDLIENSQVINRLEHVREMFELGKLPVFLPSNFMMNDDPLENSWSVTSDSIAIYIANKLNINKVVLVTDVDGIFTDDPKKHSEAQLINEISAKRLKAINKRTSVDIFLPKLLLKMQIDCYVVNGLFSERVTDILDGRNAVSTLIN